MSDKELNDFAERFAALGYTLTWDDDHVYLPTGRIPRQSVGTGVAVENEITWLALRIEQTLAEVA